VKRGRVWHRFRERRGRRAVRARARGGAGGIGRRRKTTGSGPSWAQSKNGLEDLMGHHGEVGRDGLLRWQAGKRNKKKLEITYGLERSTGRIEVGRKKI
jgi:hypothetical protein